MDQKEEIALRMNTPGKSPLPLTRGGQMKKKKGPGSSTSTVRAACRRVNADAKGGKQTVPRLARRPDKKVTKH